MNMVLHRGYMNIDLLPIDVYTVCNVQDVLNMYALFFCFGGMHNMLRVQECAAHMGGCDPKYL